MEIREKVDKIGFAAICKSFGADIQRLFGGGAD